MKKRLAALDAFQQSRPWLAVPFAVVKKFSEDKVSNLAALIAYYAFFSIFPLLLAATTILGFVLQGNPHLRSTVESSWLSTFPIIGDSIGKSGGLSGSVPALIVGLVLALWSGLAVVRTAQNAFNDVYAVAQADRPSLVGSTKRSLLLLVIVGGGLIVSTLVVGFVTGKGTFSVNLGPVSTVAGYVVPVLIDVAIFMAAFRWLTVRELTWRQTLPGAAIAAVAWYILQTFATLIINHKVAGSSGTYGTFATVIALLTWFYLTAQAVLLAAEVNTVVHGRLWPRAMVDAPKTEADERAFEAYAERERYVEDEDVDTDFGSEASPDDPLSRTGKVNPQA